jgi:hypothetical protein
MGVRLFEVEAKAAAASNSAPAVPIAPADPIRGIWRRYAIIAVLEANRDLRRPGELEGALSPAEIHQVLKRAGRTDGAFNVQEMLSKMARDKEIERPVHGRYRVWRDGEAP